MYSPKSTAFVNWLRRDLKAGNTPIVVFCGRQRSGKTAYAMRVAWEIYRDKFKYENVVDTIEKFAAAMKNNRHNIIILDEASASLFVYDWNSYLHRIFSIIQDTQAYRHNTVFIILPRVTKLDNLTKFDIDVVIEMRKYKVWSEEDKKIIKQYSYRYLQHIKQYSSFKNRNPILNFIGEFQGVPLPPPHIWDPYVNGDQAKFKEKILDDQLDIIAQKQNPTVAPSKPKPITNLVPIKQ